MDVATMHASTGQAWGEAAARYETEIESDVAFLRAGGTNFCPPERPVLGPLLAAGGRVIHLQCAGGRDTLSLWKLGASEVVGIDINERMIACARAKSELLGAPAQWVVSDILAVPSTWDATADVVYTGRGALCWMMDLAGWARVAARLLRPGGHLYIFEGHPLDWVWDMEASALRLDAVYGDYFATAPVADTGWPTAYIPVEFHSATPATKYERQWPLGQIVTAVAEAGLRIERLEEHPDRYWNIFPNLPAEVLDRLPHTFSLLARKTVE